MMMAEKAESKSKDERKWNRIRTDLCRTFHFAQDKTDGSYKEDEVFVYALMMFFKERTNPK